MPDEAESAVNCAAPPAGALRLRQAVPSQPSKAVVVLLNLTAPTAGDPGRCPVVPSGRTAAPVPPTGLAGLSSS